MHEHDVVELRGNVAGHEPGTRGTVVALGDEWATVELAGVEPTRALDGLIDAPLTAIRAITEADRPDTARSVR